MRWRWALAVVSISLTSTPASAQDQPEALHTIPFEVRFAASAADSILTSSNGGVRLEAFANDTITGVYLTGQLGGQPKSVGFGIDPGDRRYLWFSVRHTSNIEYVAMLFDVDADLTPEFMLFRTIDTKRKTEYAIDYRAPDAIDEIFDITFQPACVEPACDPASWTVRPQQMVAVPAAWFGIWRALFGVAAARGEAWIGRPVATLRPVPPTDQQ
jgi:hypothetical protein